MSDPRVRQAPAERFEGTILRFELAAELAALRAEPTPARHGHRQKTLYKRGGCTVALFALEAGGELPEHAAAGTVSIQAIQGEIVVSVADAEERLGPGQVLITPPGVRHGVRALVPSAFLLQVCLEA